MEIEPDAYINCFTSLTLLSTLPLGELIGIFFVLLALLAGSALISGSEIAFFSLSPNDIENLKNEDSSHAKRILNLLDQPKKLLATILISNNFINIAIVVLSYYLLENTPLKILCIQWGASIYNTIYLFSTNFWTTVIYDGITVVGVTFLLVLFGEIAPKVYAKINNIKLAKQLALPLVGLQSSFSPISRLLIYGTEIIESRLEKKQGSTSKEDIGKAIELTVTGGSNAKQDIDILKSIVRFGDVSVKQIMRSRVDVIAVDFRIPYQELLQIIRDSGYSRIPVFDEDFDNVTGILYVKDLLEHIDQNSGFEWQKLIRTNVHYVPEAKKIDDLLREFQAKHLHMAIVVDEYGGSAGIATLEDIMEEVIGEIRDEFDDHIELDFVKLDDHNYVFEGKTLLNDVCRVIGVDTITFDDIKGDADSIAGLILEILGQFPKIEEEILYKQFTFRIIAVTTRRVEQVKISIQR